LGDRLLPHFEEELPMSTAGKPQEGVADAGKAKTRRVIKGNLPYTPAPGVFKKSLEGIITAGQSERFTSNFMDTVLGVSGGSSRYVPPLLKKMGFLTSDGTPTDLYTSFRTEGSRSSGAYTGLKNAFGELFQRNEFIHKANEPEVRDNIVAITGLTKNDAQVNYIWSTFKVVRDFITGDPTAQSKAEPARPKETPLPPSPQVGLPASGWLTA
jgi:hypothetical protein